MSSYRFTLLVGCITALVLATVVAIKIVLIMQNNVHQTSSPSISNAVEILKIDPDFYRDNKHITKDVTPITKDSTSIIKDVTPITKEITAKAYLVGNINTGEIYSELNSNTALPVASMSKLITALVALNEYKPKDKITITTEETNVPIDGSMLTPGETFAVDEILYPLLLSSSNVAAEALASSTDRIGFLELMSSYAWEIGMPSSYFADPSGLDPHNHASAKDLFVLARYIMKYRPDVAAITRKVRTVIATTTEHGSHIFESTHPFVYDPGFIGGKTGRTMAAGETMLTMIKVGGQDIAIVVLGSDYGARERDTRKLIEKVRDLL